MSGRGRRWASTSGTVRFWSKVDRSAGTDECWPWTACLHNKGYGMMKVNNPETGFGPHIHKKAHRLAWMFANGPIPEGLHILHKCYNPPCCNPRHLYAGTNRQNVQDRIDRGKTTGCPGEANHSAKLSEGEVREIARRYSELPRSPSGRHMGRQELADEFGISGTLVRRIALGKAWSHLWELTP